MNHVEKSNRIKAKDLEQFCTKQLNVVFKKVCLCHFQFCQMHLADEEGVGEVGQQTTISGHNL